MKKNKLKPLTLEEWLLCLSVLYVVASVMMNIFCMKALSFGSSVIVCDAGLLISWTVFLFLNVIVEVWDENTAMVLVTFSAVVCLAVMLLAKLIVYIPTLEEYENQAQAFASVFSNGPRTIIASIVAFWIGNFINSHIIYKMRIFFERKKKDNNLMFFFRSAISTVFGQFADNTVFMLLAFAPVGLSLYEMEMQNILTAVLYGTMIEFCCETFFVPLITIPLTKKIKKVRDLTLSKKTDVK